MQLVIAEKPSVARDLARVLGVPAVGRGPWRGGGHIITWCLGHLVELEEPAAYDPAWKRWRLASLPMLPPRFILRPTRGAAARAQWRVVRELLRGREVTSVVNACDAGREGELIFRYCLELAGARLPVRRLWISSLTDGAIRAGLARLVPGSQLDPLADAARCRSEADWLVGMNATRALTVKSRASGGESLLSIGRVQTPTLALIVAREQAIRAFQPVAYAEVAGTFTTGTGASFRGTWTHAGRRRLARALAPDILARLVPELASVEPASGRPVGSTPRVGDAHSDESGGRLDGLRPSRGPQVPPEGGKPAIVESVERTAVREPPPLLFDLTSLQRTANRRFGLSAQRTLDVAQALYEKHKILSYPRTDSRHLPEDVRGEVAPILAAIAAGMPALAPFALQAATRAAEGRFLRVFDDRRVGDHHAIIPTTRTPRVDRLDRDEARVFDLVARRFVGAFFPDAESERTAVEIRVGDPASSPPPAADRSSDRDALVTVLPPPPDRFGARGQVRLVAGWQEVAGLPPSARSGESGAGADDAQALPPLAPGDLLAARYAVLARQTEPPPRFSEATLLAAMESAGKEIADDELRQAMKDCGLGTPATRAATIETLLERRYIARGGKSLAPTPLGEQLIAELPVESLVSAELTGRWEARLARMARGDGLRADFMADIRAYVAEVVAAIVAAPARGEGTANAAVAAPVGRCPLCGAGVVAKFKYFACAGDGCAFKIWNQIAGRRISAAVVGVLLRSGRTRELQGFRSRAGKRFSAAIVLDPTGAAKLSFRGERTEGIEASAMRPPLRAASRPRAPRRAPLPLPGCPHCLKGQLVEGKRAWGCSRWRDGCKLVIPFAPAGKRLTGLQLARLVSHGVTRKTAAGRIRLDLGTDPPSVRVESPAVAPSGS